MPKHLFLSSYCGVLACQSCPRPGSSTASSWQPMSMLESGWTYERLKLNQALVWSSATEGEVRPCKSISSTPWCSPDRIILARGSRIKPGFPLRFRYPACPPRAGAGL